MPVKRTIIVYRENDPFELPLAVFDYVSECAEFIGCEPQSLYKNMHLHGEMKANGYVLELVAMDDYNE